MKNQLLFLLPFLALLPPIFVRSRQLYAPEVSLYILAIFTILALIFAIFLLLFRKNKHTIIFLVPLLIFVNIDLNIGFLNALDILYPISDISNIYFRSIVYFLAAIIIIAFIAIFYNLAGRDRVEAVSIMLVVSALASILLSDLRPLDNWERDSAAASATPRIEAPPIIVVILDGMTGLGGIDISTKIGRKLHRNVKDFHSRNGFALYGNAFSRHRATLGSISNTLNYIFTGVGEAESIVSTPKEGSSRHFLEYNLLFDNIKEFGHSVSVYQSPYLSYCNHPAVRKCNTLAYNNPKNGYIIDEMREKDTMHSFNSIRHISRDVLTLTYIRLVLKNIIPNSVYQYFSGGVWWSVGTYNGPSFKLFFREFISDLKKSSGGESFLAHFIFPHDPYVLGETCELTRDNAAGHFAELIIRKEYYYEQVACAYALLDELLQAIDSDEHLRNATVILMGDHGPRETSGKYFDLLSWREKVDVYSTLFSIRRPNTTAEYHTTQISVQQLMGSLLFDNLASVREDEIENTVIARSSDSRERRVVPMPKF